MATVKKVPSTTDLHQPTAIQEEQGPTASSVSNGIESAKKTKDYHRGSVATATSAYIPPSMTKIGAKTDVEKTVVLRRFDAKEFVPIDLADLIAASHSSIDTKAQQEAVGRLIKTLNLGQLKDGKLNFPPRAPVRVAVTGYIFTNACQDQMPENVIETEHTVSASLLTEPAEPRTFRRAQAVEHAKQELESGPAWKVFIKETEREAFDEVWQRAEKMGVFAGIQKRQPAKGENEARVESDFHSEKYQAWLKAKYERPELFNDMSVVLEKTLGISSVHREWHEYQYGPNNCLLYDMPMHFHSRGLKSASDKIGFFFKYPLEAAELAINAHEKTKVFEKRNGQTVVLPPVVGGDCPDMLPAEFATSKFQENQGKLVRVYATLTATEFGVTGHAQLNLDVDGYEVLKPKKV